MMLYNFAQLEIPILGICFGYQILNTMFGGSIIQMAANKKGFYNIYRKGEHHLFKNFPERFKVELYHNDMIDRLANFFKVIAVDYHGNPMAIVNDKHKIYGTQFHPEGRAETQAIIMNFVNICEAETETKVTTRSKSSK